MLNFVKYSEENHQILSFGANKIRETSTKLAVTTYMEFLEC